MFLVNKDEIQDVNGSWFRGACIIFEVRKQSFMEISLKFNCFPLSFSRQKKCEKRYAWPLISNCMDKVWFSKNKIPVYESFYNVFLVFSRQTTPKDICLTLDFELHVFFRGSQLEGVLNIFVKYDGQVWNMFQTINGGIDFFHEKDKKKHRYLHWLPTDQMKNKKKIHKNKNLFDFSIMKSRYF